jgi:hypothetical protein
MLCDRLESWISCRLPALCSSCCTNKINGRNIAKKLVSIISILLVGLLVSGQQIAPLKLVAKYHMPDSVQYRFDHLGIDTENNRLFAVAEQVHQVQPDL